MRFEVESNHVWVMIASRSRVVVAMILKAKARRLCDGRGWRHGFMGDGVVWLRHEESVPVCSDANTEACWVMD